MPCLSHEAIGELEAAKHHAGTLGLPLNTHLSFTPFADTPALPSPADIADSFGRLLKHLSVWVKRRTGCRFTYIRVAHTDDDGSGRNPHLHVLLHLPTDDDRGELQAALLKLYGYTATGLVADVRSGTTKRKRNECGYWGSTFDYITRHKSQQAFRRQNGASWRASRRDETGRHVGIKCPFVGRRWAISRNIQRQGAASP